MNVGATRRGCALAVMVVGVAACIQSSRPAAVRAPPLGLDAVMPVGDDATDAPAVVTIGAALFADPILSADSTVSCASCHQPDLAFTDGRRIARGIFGQAGTRNTPSLLNRGYGATFFWDARAKSMEDAVLRPIGDSREMGSSPERAVARIRQAPRYRALVRRAFGADTLDVRTLRIALAAFVRSLRAANAPVDRYVAGDTLALTVVARRGRRLFIGKANCVACHVGPLFTDEAVHNTGVSPQQDPGHFLVSHDSADLGRFKTPSLRNVARTAPYMHDGSMSTLEDVIGFYDRGGGDSPRLDREIRPLKLSTGERHDLVAFLQALGSPQ